MRLSLIIPAYNEARILPGSLRRLHEAFPEAELILVSDGCRDDTLVVCGAFSFPVRVLSHRPNRGKGFAVKRGMLAARGELLVFTDADLPFGTDGVAAIVECLAAPDTPDIIIASKAAEQRGFVYRAARSLVRRAVRGLLGLRFVDTQAGLKGFRREPAMTIFAQTIIERFATDMEILYIAQQHGYRVEPVPLDLDETHFRPSSFTAKQGAMLLRDIWRIRRTAYR